MNNPTRLLPRLILLFFLLSHELSQAQIFFGSGGIIPDGGPQAAFQTTVSGLPASIDSSFGLETVCLTISHTNDGDLSIRLLAPDGSMVDLSLSNGGSGNHYTNTCFNAFASNSINSANPPFNGTYRPENLMGVVNNGQNPNGIWKLLILDASSPITGSLTNWRLEFGNNPAPASTFKSSDLPIVVINTNGQAVLDEPKITAHMGIISNGAGQRNAVNDPFNNYNNWIGIEYRGSTSQGFPQKPFGLETRDSAGNDLDTSLLGMPAEHDWILYPPYNDKSLMRNVLTYDLARKMGHYATRTKYCELILNGQYQGIYVLMEKIKRDKYRLNVAELDSNDVFGDELTGGYLFKIDKFTGGGGDGWVSNYSPVAHSNGQYIYYQYEYPDQDDIVIQQKSYLQSFVDSFENALSTIPLSDTINGYRHFTDLNSFIDFFIVNELSRNVDGYRLSSFFFKNKESKGGKLRAGPVWDFNIAFKNANYCGGNLSSGWAFDFGSSCGTDPNQIPFWWEKFMQDTYFTNQLRCRWQELRSTYINTSYIYGLIDSVVALTAESRVRHYAQWPILGVYVWPNPSPIPSTYSGEINALKSFINARINWLDAAMPGTCSTSLAEVETKEDEMYFTHSIQDQQLLLHNTKAVKGAILLDIYNSLGQLQQSIKLTNTGNELRVNLREFGLKTGIYLVKCSSSSESLSGKIMYQE